jgi:hypothetical protein
MLCGRQLRHQQLWVLAKVVGGKQAGYQMYQQTLSELCRYSMLRSLAGQQMVWSGYGI